MKRLVSAALAALFCMTLLCMPAYAADSIKRTATFEDIGSLNDNGELRYFGIYSTNATSRENCEINTDPEYAHNSSKSLWFAHGSSRNFFYNTDSAIITKLESSTAATVQQCYRFEYKYYLKFEEYEESYSGGIAYVDNPQIGYAGSVSYRPFTGLNVQMIKSASGTTSLQMGNNSEESIYLSEGEEYDWIEIKRVFKFDDSTIDTFVNGQLLATRYIDDLTSARMSSVSITGTDKTKGVFIDDVSTISYERPPEITDIAAEKDKLTLTFSKPLDEKTVSADNFSVALGAKDIGISAVEYIADENKVIVTPSCVLAAEADYTLTATGAVMSETGVYMKDGKPTSMTFKIAAQPFDVLNAAIEGGKVTAKLVNTTGSAKTAIMAVIFKNADGAAVSFGYTNLTSVPAEGAALEVELPGKGETSCEVFFVDNWSDRLPLWKYIYKLTEVE